MIRYRLGDLAARLPGRCRCGRGLGLLSPVQGRTRHVVRLPGGRLIVPMMVSVVVKPFTEVRRWQLHEVSPGNLRLLVVPTDHWQAAAGTALAGQLDAKFGPGVRFEVVPVEDISLAATGKFQTIVPLEERS